MENALRKIPDFFKVYRPEYSSRRMRIPRDFLAQLDRPLSGEILLRRCTGRHWRVKVILEAQDAYFDDGWQEFVRDNLVEINDFMVFSYRSHGVFSVVVYGHSACEKKECPIPEEVEEGGEAQELDSDDDENYEGEEEDEEEEEEEHEARRKQSKKEGNTVKRKAADEDPIDVERYINTKNPYFVTMIRNRRSAPLYVPCTALNDYELKLPLAVEFQDPNGRTWRGKVKVWKDGRTWISGWKALCRHHNLKKNDRCICELLEKDGVTGRIIKVHIL
ncbi:B3 domain-containing protein At4g34400-like [Rhodamnia argentea]|uniref:B3 domain-containing protein At4g34400-like n=1 Tax=Rhodamnia argentea TaxID=178133 RepID=A0A8B8NMW8_9MYRT|nr:B3 domain-containing protein At4g34400-like [Rhodamnia argentea]XP_030523324.1 B3 domain-containing protein At4g34400-like [Rhodamnia argentea]XP_048128915.1 B3 domain-containing protein At4g34400-like [Rhodamnia argentea]